MTYSTNPKTYFYFHYELKEWKSRGMKYGKFRSWYKEQSSQHIRRTAKQMIQEQMEDE